jgi:hypothetical protein
MLEDFKRALARVQSDYGFYIDCQTNSTVALAGYDLSPDERSALTDPEKLADVFKRVIGISELRPITIKICGTHDWVNRAATKDNTRRDARVASEVDAIRRSSTGKERSEAVVRLMELIG